MVEARTALPFLGRMKSVCWNGVDVVGDVTLADQTWTLSEDPHGGHGGESFCCFPVVGGISTGL